MAQLSFPLDAFAPSVAQNAQEGQLWSHMVNLCLRKFGLPPLSSTNLSESIDQGIRVRQYTKTRRYGLSDRASAELYGYGMPKWARGSAKPQSFDEVPPEQALVLRGAPQGSADVQHQSQSIPDGGCAGEATRAIGTDDGGSYLAESLQAKTFELMRTKPRAKNVIEQWSQCMKRKGFNYPDPWNAGNGFGAADGEPGPPTSEEIKSAVTSVDCSYAVNLPGKLFAVESDLQNIEIDNNAEALKKEKKRVESRARHLQSLVQKHGG
ncbi:hypothetical protein [Actinomadura sp. 7K534]|uniref:hypothetical protein n=1 Tax=Actinomadura sp. 7K534 TaxID=2530366 RepID=UPI001047162F|nr:hypothetical protein [Actinomadura sp. 7K534]TDB99257.1 hypothetical protein E1266_00230 [Actinomadura sp. 7K534]